MHSQKLTNENLGGEDKSRAKPQTDTPFSTCAAALEESAVDEQENTAFSVNLFQGGTVNATWDLSQLLTDDRNEKQPSPPRPPLLAH